MQALTDTIIEEFRKSYTADKNAQYMSAAAANSELIDLALIPANAAKLNGDFNIEVKTRGRTTQQKTGRCWMFSCLNILREKAAEKCNMDFFELSGNYLAFYDKLEKSNNLLEMTIACADQPLDSRKMEYLLAGFHDGGLWPMAADLIRKYGIVPKDVMPETYQSSHTAQFTKLQLSLLRKDMAELRDMIHKGEDPSQRKKEMMKEIFKAQCISFGMPVTHFDFEYRDRDGVYHSDKNITPRQFYDKYIGIDLDEYVHIISEPTLLKPFYKMYRSHNIGSMAESNIVSLNLPIDEVRELCIAQLKAGEPVWFGCDSTAYENRKAGIWDMNSVDYTGILGGADLFMNKRDRFTYRDSYADHNMILCGVNIDETGKANRWKIENSWFEDGGHHGYFVCGDEYFEEFVYEAAISRRYMSEKQKAMLEQTPVDVEPWQR